MGGLQTMQSDLDSGLLPNVSPMPTGRFGSKLSRSRENSGVTPIPFADSLQQSNAYRPGMNRVISDQSLTKVYG
jgi:hypothetical protein